MRRIGPLKNASKARKLLGYLRLQSIDSTIDLVDDDDADGAWNLWVRDESSVETARAAYTDFLQSPGAAKFDVEPADLPSNPEPVASDQVQLRSARQQSAARELDRLGAPIDDVAKQKRIPVVIAIIAISVLLSWTTNFGQPAGNQSAANRSFSPWATTKADSNEPSIDERVFAMMSFVDQDEFLAENGDSFASIRKGEWWRFFTPIFLHGDIFHLAFNMLWIFFLGSAIEKLHGSLFFAALVMLTQLGGMLLQVCLPAADWLPESLHGSPFAIGASGAVYGLFGFLWIRPLVDRAYPIQMIPENVIIMLVMLVVCMTPLIPNIANGAHLGGLVAGMGLGAIRFIGRYSDSTQMAKPMTRH